MATNKELSIGSVPPDALTFTPTRRHMPSGTCLLVRERGVAAGWLSNVRCLRCWQHRRKWCRSVCDRVLCVLEETQPHGARASYEPSRALGNALTGPTGS